MLAEPIAAQAELQLTVEPSGWVLGLELPPRQTVSQWADQHRIIAAGTSPEPGRWSTARAPFTREPMDCCNDPDIDTIVLEWSSQVGKTEVLINAAAFFIAQDPSPQLFVLPDLGLAESFSRSRFGPTIEATPALLDAIGRHRSRDSDTTILEKTYPGGDIVFAGANSPASLASRPRRVVIFDEIDKYKASIGNDGDPIKQGFQRTQNFWNRKKLLASTPTIEGASAIDHWFKRSDQRHFEVPCPRCARFQALEWENVKWEKGRPETARYICAAHDPVTGELCQHPMDQREIVLAVRHGHWKARAHFNGIAGFRVWAIYSPYVTMAALAAEWEDSEGKPTEEQTFTNLKLGRCYNPTQAAQTTPEILFERREDYGPRADGGYDLPADVLAITAHVDVQANRFECQYLGWGAADEKWVLDLAKHYDDPTDPRAFVRMQDALLTRRWTHPLGGDLGIEAVGIDAGFLQQSVMDFVREQKAAFKIYFAIKGMPGFGRPLMRESEQRFKLGAKLHLSGVDDGKTLLYAELAMLPDPDKGRPTYRIHFPRHLDIDYFRQLVSERVKIEIVSGRPVRKWMPPAGGRRNEALDTFVGNMAVRSQLSIDYEQRRRALSGTSAPVTGATIASLFKR